MERAIVHMDLDAFFVSCERLHNSKLNGIPLIVGGGERGVVASCSYEARKFGVRSAMPIKLALRLCPDAKIIKGDFELYSQLSKEVTEVLEDKAPVVEKASIDEFYLDMTGMDKIFGCYKFTNELAGAVTKETGLAISFALSVNKTVAKIGTGEGKPKGNLQILENSVRPFLNPLSIQKIPGLGNATFTLLSRIGIRNIETLAEMPPEVLQQMIGKNGLDLWQKANGIDFTPVKPYRERKSISSEHTFLEDTIDIPMIKTMLAGMVEKLAFRLRNEGWLTSAVTVKIRYSNFDTETKQRKIDYTTSDHTLIHVVSELFDMLFNRRMRIRLIGINFSGLVRGTYQMNMFEDTEETMKLLNAMDRIKKKFGEEAVARCSGKLNFKDRKKICT